MKKKIFSKVLVILCCLALVVSVSGCGTKEAAAPAKKSASEITIGFCNYGASILSYITVLDQEFRAEATKLGVKTIIYDAAGDAIKQDQQMDTLIQQKPDVIVIVPIDPKAIVPRVKQAKEAGIPVLICNSPIDESGLQYTTCFTGSDQSIAGQMAAQILAEGLGGKGRIIEIPGLPGYQVTIQKSGGFAEELKKYPDMKIIDSQPGDYSRAKTQTVMENFITKYKGEFDAVYVPNDDCAAGAINALKAAGLLDKVKVIDSTFLGNGYDLIKNGELLGSVMQSPIKDADLAIDTAFKIAQGETVPATILFDNVKVTKTNLEEVGKPSW